MKRCTGILTALLILGQTLSAGAVDPARHVNPFVGTDDHGHTNPSACYPFGMVQAGPDTRTGTWDGCGGYHYSDSVILGFTHTHLSGTGCLDYGDVLIMPVRGENVASKFSHSRETASPGFYSVYLEGPQVEASMAAGRRMAMHEYRYTIPGDREIVIDLRHRDRLMGSFLKMDGDRAVEGWRLSRSWAKKQDVYFHAEFSEPVKTVAMRDSSFVRLGFGPGKAPLKLKIGISSVSCSNARQNLLSEKKEGDWNMESLRRSCRAVWNKWLSRIEVCGDDALLKTFCTALYHCAVHPSLYSDVGGEYRGMDRKVHRAEGFERYTVLSIWDVFRAAFPLYNMIARDYMPDFLESMLSICKEGGLLPKWELAGNETNTMIGFNTVSILADAYVKGTLPKERLEEFYEAARVTAENNSEAYGFFCRYGFDPAGDDDQSVSKTLEFAYDSWCVAVLASALGRQGDYKKYIERAQYWKNVYDASTGFMRPREHGAWAPDFNPAQVSSHFTEANSWQYSFFVPQDIAGHIAAMGGTDAYVRKLDSLFVAGDGLVQNNLVDVTGLVGQYAHGNEPSHHVAYLYDFAGQPWKTQKLTRDLCRQFYTSLPDGLCGNEDCGQMSAWYVLSALGLYSVTPGTTVMALSSPLFRKAVIHTGGRCFTVRADRPEHTYIGSAKLDGKPFDSASMDFSRILSGGSLVYRMSATPTAFGQTPANVTSIDPEYEYKARFEPDFGKRKETAADPSLKVTLGTQYYPSYAAGGPQGLVDGRRGRPNWRAGLWQGYRGCSFDATVDLLGTRTVSGVWAEFLQDMNNYIWMPGEMRVYVSADGVDFTLAGIRRSDVPVDAEKKVIQTWTVDFDPVEAAFVRIVATQFGEIPSWHRGYGDKGFIFVDEIGILQQ